MSPLTSHHGTRVGHGLLGHGTDGLPVESPKGDFAWSPTPRLFGRGVNRQAAKAPRISGGTIEGFALHDRFFGGSRRRLSALLGRLPPLASWLLL